MKNIISAFVTLVAVIGFNVTALGMGLALVSLAHGAVALGVFMGAFIYATEFIDA